MTPELTYDTVRSILNTQPIEIASSKEAILMYKPYTQMFIIYNKRLMVWDEFQSTSLEESVDSYNALVKLNHAINSEK